MLGRLNLTISISDFSLPSQISDIHQFYTRNYEVRMDELEFVMSSISNSGAIRLQVAGGSTVIINLLAIIAAAAGSLIISPMIR